MVTNSVKLTRSPAGFLNNPRVSSHLLLLSLKQLLDMWCPISRLPNRCWSRFHLHSRYITERMFETHSRRADDCSLTSDSQSSLSTALMCRYISCWHHNIYTLQLISLMLCNAVIISDGLYNTAIIRATVCRTNQWPSHPAYTCPGWKSQIQHQLFPYIIWMTFCVGLPESLSVAADCVFIIITMLCRGRAFCFSTF